MEAVKIVSIHNESLWGSFMFITFDCPSKVVSSCNFGDRYYLILANIMCSHPIIVVCPLVLCLNAQHIILIA
jgi:hypothetical protein